MFNDAATVNFVSHNPDMADLDVEIVALSLTGTVNNYAESAFAFGSGAGSFSQGGSIFTLDFGTVFQGSGLFTTNLLALNAASGPADLLDGMFQFLDSMDFGESGFNPFTSFRGRQQRRSLDAGLRHVESRLLRRRHRPARVRPQRQRLPRSGRRRHAAPTAGNVVERTNGVPEPGALAMVALGLLLLVGSRRRQIRGARTRH